MRVSSLSDERVIDLLNRYFIPAWLSRDRYQQTPDKAEEAELQRIDRQRHDRGLEGGTVTVHILAPDGTVAAALPVQKASKPEQLVHFLKEYAEREKVKKRLLLDKPTLLPPWQDLAKAKTPDGLLFNVWTRFDDGTSNRGLGADTFELTAKEWSAFIPKSSHVGDAWSIPDAVADKVFALAYPPLPNWDARQSKMMERSLTATILKNGDTEVSLKIEGRFTLSYPATGKPTDGKVAAKVAGYAMVDPKTNRLKELALTSLEANYVWFWENKPQPRKMSFAIEMRR